MPLNNHSHGQNEDSSAIDVDTLLLIVVGAHPRAEVHDRGTAYRLRQSVERWMGQRYGAEQRQWPVRPLVVTDVWFLNDASMRRCPAVSIGGPGVNAFSAYLGDKLPSAFCVDDTLMVQMDLDLTDVLACCWGVDAESTLGAVDVFTTRYLDAFLDAAVRERV